MYQIFLTKNAAKEIKKQGKQFKKKASEILQNLALDPTPPLAERLTGELDFIYSYHFSFAGTSFRLAYTIDKNHKDSKIERERLALERLKSEFPEHAEFFSYCEEYDKKENDEARFVYALDKLYPSLNIYLENGRTWKKQKISLPDIVAYKGEKIKLSPILEKYWKELLEILERNKTELFND